MDRVLHRKKRNNKRTSEVDISGLLKTILRRANEFVPSESGSIFLDDPVLKIQNNGKGKLYFISCFGKGSSAIVGQAIPSDTGIVGKTYTSGVPYISKDVKADKHFYKKIDTKTKFTSRSIICVPIEIHETRIGAIELINRKEKINFEQRDLVLLQIFAGYTSTLIQNTLDAKTFEKLSRLDNLTGLYNDRFFFESLETEIERAVDKDRDVSLIFFDLDHFKEVNDTHGHLAGSRVLKEVGALLENIFDGTGAFLARYGGDEYVIIMPNADIKKAGDYGEALRRKIEGNVFVKESLTSKEKALNIKGLITSSVGVASLRENVMLDKTITKLGTMLISQADAAMYDAKEKGRNRVCFAEGKQ